MIGTCKISIRQARFELAIQMFFWSITKRPLSHPATGIDNLLNEMQLMEWESTEM
jgi:hypothetical protein